MDVSGKIAQANGRLKSNRVGVRIEQIGQKLYLQATLPPKPSSDRLKPFQQRIALQVGAHPRGVSLAEAEARKVGALLDCDEFNWEPYLPTKHKAPSTVADWLERFERDQRHQVSDSTWRTEYHNVFSKLPQDAGLTFEVLRSAILNTEANTRTRKRFCTTLGALAKFAGLEVSFDDLRGNYSQTEVDPRTLPKDELIVEWFHQIPNDNWRYVYGLLATFGLRNHEAFFLDLEPLQQGKPYVKVLQGKTGARLVWAFHPEWIEEFQLKNPCFPDVNGKNHEAYGSRVSHQFERYKIPFNAYDLRHRWAVRTLEYCLPSELAAKQMGHSVAVHERIYHHWITSDTHQRMYEALLMRNDRPQPPTSSISSNSFSMRET